MFHPIKMSEAVSLALHAASLLAGSAGRLLRTKEIAGVLGASEAHLSKVLQRMTRAGLVKPTRGPAGGFGLARPADKISLKDIYEAVDGPLDVVSCPLSIPFCEGGWCVLGQELSSRGRDLVRFLSRTRLSALKIKVPDEPRPNRANSRGSPPAGGSRRANPGKATGRAGRLASGSAGARRKAGQRATAKEARKGSRRRARPSADPVGAGARGHGRRP